MRARTLPITPKWVRWVHRVALQQMGWKWATTNLPRGTQPYFNTFSVRHSAIHRPLAHLACRRLRQPCMPTQKLNALLVRTKWEAQMQHLTPSELLVRSRQQMTEVTWLRESQLGMACSGLFLHCHPQRTCTCQTSKHAPLVRPSSYILTVLNNHECMHAAISTAVQCGSVLDHAYCQLS